jgi:hypothetical protein
MQYAVITPAWDTEGKFFVIDAARKEELIISTHGSSTYAEALPEMEAAVLAAFDQFDASTGKQEIDQYLFIPATEDWYLAEAQVR